MDLSWMAWTPHTAVFFVAIFLALAGMTAWEALQPAIPRKGFLPLVTTRGDRFFLGLLSGAWVQLAWLGLTDFSLWYSLTAMLVWMVVLLRWG
jgi:predicted small integral membrane protein